LEGASWEIVEITNTRQQVVGGMKYFAEGKFRDTVDQSIYEAVITIYERSWENFVQGRSIETARHHIIISY
jgi:hypothetical protein